MKRLLARVARRLAPLAARVAALLISRLPSGDEQFFAIFERRGLHLLRKSYYSPIPHDVPPGYWDAISELPGLDMNERAALTFLRDVVAPFMPEFRAAFPIEKQADASRFYLLNGFYMAVDAHVLYAIIRHGKPRRIVEIGSGNSTRLAAAACLKNREETGRTTSLVAIEPYPNADLRAGFDGLTELIPKRLQEVGLAPFQALEGGDLLFIDSTHVLRAGNDVELEYLEILPRLASGVLVHVHDVSLPRRYPKLYFDQGLFWNEQQLLQAFLAFNERFEVLWPGNYMLLKHPQEVRTIFPEIDDMRRLYPFSEPTAFWMRTR